VRTNLLRDALLAGAVVMAEACGSDWRSTSAPSPLRPLATLTITGKTSIVPGEVTTLTAAVTSAGQAPRDVTNEVRWETGSDGTLIPVSPGTFRGGHYGRTSVIATYAPDSLRSSVPMRVVPDGMFLLVGFVTDFTGAPVPSAAAVVRSGGATVSASTDEHGTFVLPASGDTVVNVEKVGFKPGAKRLTVSEDQGVEVVLSHAVTGETTGDYTLTFNASTSCKLPPAAMQRTYQAHIEELDRALWVRLDGAEFMTFGTTPGFTGKRDGDRVQFRIADGSVYEDDFVLVEHIPDVGDMSYAAMADGIVTDRGITATVSGMLTIRLPGTACFASDHRMELVRLPRTTQ
jgi:hypothetical protein